MSTNVLISLHLCVCGHASADGTVWSISCCSRDKRTQTVSSHWPLKSSQQGKWYQIPVWHPLRRGEGFTLRKFTFCLCSYVWPNLTNLKSSEDTVGVYVVLGADKHGWRWGYGVTVIAGWMTAGRQEQSYKLIITVEYLGHKCHVSWEISNLNKSLSPLLFQTIPKHACL